MITRERIGIAVVGFGYWGPNHVRCLSRMSDCRVTAVDLDPKRLERLAHDFPNVRRETDLKRVLADESIHAVVVATPTGTHFQVVRDAILAGKHVLCEKPLCTQSSQAEELVELAHKHNVVLMTGHIFLFNGGIQKVKELVDVGELGTMQYMSAVRTNLGPIRSDVNAAVDLATHDISIFNWILDSEPESVSAVGGAFVQNGIHDVVFMHLRYPQGQLASIQVSWLNPKKVRQITLVGSQRMITCDDLDLSTPVAVYDRRAQLTQDYTDYGEFLRVSMWDGDVRLPKVKATEPLKVQDRAFIDAILDRGVVRSGGLFSLGVVRVLEAAEESLATGGHPVRVERQDGSPPGATPLPINHTNPIAPRATHAD